MTKAPPERDAAHISEEVPQNCPEGYACYTDREDASIARAFLHLTKLERWASLSWSDCKPAEGDEGEQ